MLDAEDLYDELSRMLQLYRRKTDYCDKLLHRFAHEFFDERDIFEIRQQLSTMFLEELRIVDRYLQQQFNGRALKMVLYRFFSRIVEIVRSQRAKIRGKLHTSLVAYFDSIENLIYVMVSSSAGMVLDGLLSFYDRSQDYAVELLAMLDEKNKRNTRSVPRPLVLDPPPLKLNVPNPEVIELPSPAKTVQAISEESPQKKPPKIMEGLRVLDCLDLDAGNFRSTYLYCKHHNTIIEEETGERNQMIAQEIKAYKKAYVEYQVRRMRRAQYIQRMAEQSEQEQPSTPLQAITQTSTSPTKRSRHSRLVQKEHTSLRKMEIHEQPQAYYFKENANSTGFIDAARTIGNFYKSAKPNLCPKKVLLCFNKLSLRPVDPLNKSSTPLSNKKRSRTRSSSRRLGDSFDMLIEGQRIKDKDVEMRRTGIKYPNEKSFASNLFYGNN